MTSASSTCGRRPGRSTAQRGHALPIASPGLCRLGRLVRWNLRWERCRHALMPM
jgi:hypothetical protein